MKSQGLKKKVIFPIRGRDRNSLSTPIRAHDFILLEVTDAVNRNTWKFRSKISKTYFVPSNEAVRCWVKFHSYLALFFSIRNYQKKEDFLHYPLSPMDESFLPSPCSHEIPCSTPSGKTSDSEPSHNCRSCFRTSSQQNCGIT